MLFEIPDKLFAASDNDHLILRLASMAFEGRHRVAIDDAAIAFSKWFGDLPQSLQEIVKLGIEDSNQEHELRPSAFRIKVTDGHDDWKQLALSLASAVELAEKPFRIMLEDNHSDWEFLKATMREADRKWLEARIEREWLEIEHCGGIGGIRTRLTAYTGKPGKTLRLAIVCDSDRVEMLPDGAEKHDDIGQDQKRILELARSPTHRPLTHILERRMIENYLPTNRLRKRSGETPRQHARKLDDLKKLSQRDVYNMKDGFSGDRKRSPPPSWLPGPTRWKPPLEKGFGKDVADAFQDCHLDVLDKRAQDELTPFVRQLLSRIR